MTNLDNIIMDIKEVNRTHDFWIRNSNGEIKDDIICGDIIPFLEELKEYEVEMSQADIKDVINVRNSGRYNTYNCSAKIDHDIEYRIIESAHDEVWFAFMVHRYGDVRCNYTDWAICKFDYAEGVFELETTIQHKDVIGRYMVDIDIFSERYEVYDYINNKDIGTFYDIEVKDLLESIKEVNQ